MLLGYCDGDVADLQGIHYYDDVRYNLAGDLAPKHVIMVFGANHAYYNTTWGPPIVGSYDDWLQFTPGGSSDPFCGPNVPGNGRLTLEQQKGTGLKWCDSPSKKSPGQSHFKGRASG